MHHSNSYQYFGVWIDKRLSFTAQVAYLRGKDAGQAERDAGHDTPHCRGHVIRPAPILCAGSAGPGVLQRSGPHRVLPHLAGATGGATEHRHEDHAGVTEPSKSCRDEALKYLKCDSCGGGSVKGVQVAAG